MSKKFFIAWIVIFVAWLAGSFVVHGLLLHDDYSKLTGLFRSEAESQQFFPLMILAHVLLAEAFVWIIPGAWNRSRGSRRASASARQWRCRPSCPLT